MTDKVQYLTIEQREELQLLVQMIADVYEENENMVAYKTVGNRLAQLIDEIGNTVHRVDLDLSADVGTETWRVVDCLYCIIPMTLNDNNFRITPYNHVVKYFSLARSAALQLATIGDTVSVEENYNAVLNCGYEPNDTNLIDRIINVK